MPARWTASFAQSFPCSIEGLSSTAGGRGARLRWVLRGAGITTDDVAPLALSRAWHEPLSCLR